MAQTIKSIGSSGSSGSIGSIDASRGIDAAKKSEYGIRDHSPGWSYNLKERREEKDINSDMAPQAMKLPDLQSLSSMLYAQAAPVQTDFLTDKYTNMWKSKSAILGMPSTTGMDLSSYADFMGMAKTGNYGLPYDRNTNTILVSAKALRSDPDLMARAGIESSVMGGARVTVINDVEGEFDKKVDFWRDSDGNKTYYSAPSIDQIKSFYGLDENYGQSFKVHYEHGDDDSADYSPNIYSNPRWYEDIKLDTGNIPGSIASIVGKILGEKEHTGEWRNSSDLGQVLRNVLRDKNSNATTLDSMFNYYFGGRAASDALLEMKEIYGGDMSKFNYDEFEARQKLKTSQAIKSISKSIVDAHSPASLTSFEEMYNFYEPKGATAGRSAWDSLDHDLKHNFIKDRLSLVTRAQQLSNSNEEIYKDVQSKFDKSGKYIGGSRGWADPAEPQPEEDDGMRGLTPLFGPPAPVQKGGVKDYLSEIGFSLGMKGIDPSLERGTETVSYIDKTQANVDKELSKWRKKYKK